MLLLFTDLQYNQTPFSKTRRIYESENGTIISLPAYLYFHFHAEWQKYSFESTISQTFLHLGKSELWQRNFHIISVLEF